MRSAAIVCLLACYTISFGQNPPEYYRFSEEAIRLYKKKQYKASAETFSKAFKSNGWRGHSEDRYNAACSWNLAGYPDSAFFQLYRIATKGKFDDYRRITEDPDLFSLHNDKRWHPLLDTISANREKAQAGLNKPLVKLLENIMYTDQHYRQQLESYEERYGYNSKEIKALWDTIRKQDDANLKTVTYILDNFGWLGADVVGAEGNSALFLVIQHSNQQTQEKYLPMMREAVKRGKARPSELALLEDRVAMGQGRKQIYGSQVQQDAEGKYTVYPIEDEANVNKRRAEVGLEPLEQYLLNWNLDYKPGQDIVKLEPTFWKHNIYILLITIACAVLGTLVFVLYKRIGSKLFLNTWLWFGICLLGLNILAWLYGNRSDQVFLKKDPLVSFLCNVTYAAFIFIAGFVTSWILERLIKRRSVIIELAAVFGATCLFTLYGVKWIYKFYYPGSSIVFFFNILPAVILTGGFALIWFILWLIRRRKTAG